MLARTLKRLSETSLGGAQILILNNHSTDNTKKLIDDYRAGSLKGSIKYVENPTNVGGDANIMRCIEFADRDWVWILGDDDLPVKDSISLIISTISGNPECHYFNFSTSLLQFRADRTTGFETNGLAELIHSLDCYSNLLFISAGVYRRDFFAPFVASAYRYNYSYSCQIAILFLSSANTSQLRCYFSPEFLVHWEAPSPEHAWSPRHFNNSAALVAEAIPTIRLREEFIDHMRKVAEIAPSLTISRFMQLRINNQSFLDDCRKRYLILAILVPRYIRQALIVSLFASLSKRRFFIRFLARLERLTESPIPALAKSASYLVNIELACKDIRR